MEKKQGLELLREPFPSSLISKLPKGTKEQNNCKYEEKRKCDVCGGFHHPKVIHLDYVGHAALTDRLLDADPLWTWEPLAYNNGLPAFDSTGGLWIKLTVCGHTRIGYGHAEASSFKEIGSREKEVIGDALRNAAMRFGAALDLWHKGDLHPENNEENKKDDVPDIQPDEYITLEQQTTINGIIIDKNVDKTAFLKFMGAASIPEIKASDYKHAIESLKMAKGKKIDDPQRT